MWTGRAVYNYTAIRRVCTWHVYGCLRRTHIGNQYSIYVQATVTDQFNRDLSVTYMSVTVVVVVVVQCFSRSTKIDDGQMKSNLTDRRSTENVILKTVGHSLRLVRALRNLV